MAVKKAQRDQVPYVELSVRLTDGSFAARMEFSPHAPREDRDRVVTKWLELIGDAARMCKRGPRA